MTVTHRFRRPGDFQFDRAAKTTSNMCHEPASENVRCDVRTRRERKVAPSIRQY